MVVKAPNLNVEGHPEGGHLTISLNNEGSIVYVCFALSATASFNVKLFVGTAAIYF